MVSRRKNESPEEFRIRANAARKAWYASHKEQVCEAQRAYYQTRKDYFQTCAIGRYWQPGIRERRIEVACRYYRAHLDYYKELNRVRHERNRDSGYQVRMLESPVIWSV